MKRSIAFSGWLISAALLIATPAAAQDDVAATEVADAQNNMETRVAALLAGVERVPTSDDWAALGDGAVPVLIAVMNDSKSTIVTRGRAAIGLGYFETDDSAAALRAALTDSATPSLLVRKSIVALARIKREQAIEPISQYLEHRSKRVREVAIKAVGGIATLEARTLLEARLAVEKSKFLRELIGRQLSKPIIGAPAAPTEAPVLNEAAAGGSE